MFLWASRESGAEKKPGIYAGNPAVRYYVFPIDRFNLEGMYVDRRQGGRVYLRLRCGVCGEVRPE